MIRYGVDQLIALDPAWKNERLALLTNDAALTASGLSTRRALLNNGFNVVRLFSPEHGLSTQGADGAFINDQFDAQTGLQVVSLYGHNFEPPASTLQDVSILLFDIPDVGARFYTYLWSLTYWMQAAARYSKRVIVLDRPNPVSGKLDLAEGPFLDEHHCSSFIGRWRIPVRHSCTLGELALYFNATKNIHCDLAVVRCEDWSRHSFFLPDQQAFVPPSLALQQPNSLLLYSGTCLLEATNLHEGRGTPAAFSLVGAPWLQARPLIEKMSERFSDQVHYAPAEFISTTTRYKDKSCQAVVFEVREPAIFKAVTFGLWLLYYVKSLHPECGWDTYPTVANPLGHQHLDRLLGVNDAERWFTLSASSFSDVLQENCAIADTWKTVIKEYLLYD